MVSINKGELSQILGNKSVSAINALSVKSTAFYSAMDSVVSTAEEVTRTGSVYMSVSTPNFGSSSQVVLSTQDMILQVMLYLELPSIPAGTEYDGALSLVQGWGAASIKELRCQIGSSNETLVWSGETLMQLNLVQIETREKTDQIINMMGKPITKQINTNHSYGNWSEYAQTACVVLNLPWSTLRTGNCQSKGIPSDCLNSSINLTITFNEGRKFMNLSPSVELPYTSFSNATIYLRTSQFTDQGYSLRQNLLSDSNSFYSIPFHSARTGVIQRLESKVTSVNPVDLRSQLHSITLNGIENADLEAIMFSVVRSNSIDKVSGTPINFLDFCDIEDIEVSYNGNTIIKMPRNSHRLWSQLTSNKTGSNGFSFQPITGNDTTQVVDTDNVVEKLVCLLDLTRCNFAQSNEFNNTIRYLNGALKLSFRTVHASVAAENQHLVVSYVYPSQIVLSQGVSSLQLL